MTDMTFEQAMKRLSEIANALESDSLPLSDAIELYKEGTELVRVCRKELDDAKLQVSVLEEGGTERKYE